MTSKTVDLDLVGLDGNAFALIGAFRKQARREGWTDAEIKAVTDDATSGDYDHVIEVLARVCVPECGDEP